jgi:hypothetical protein
MLHIASKHVNMDPLNVTSRRTCGRKAGRPNFPDLGAAGDRPWSSSRDARNAAPCASGDQARRGPCARARPTRRPDIHTPPVSKQQVMSEETPIVELLGATHVKVYASGRVDGALGEDGPDCERCVVINRIPQLLLREAALAVKSAWPPGSAIASKAPPVPAGGSPFWGMVGPPWWGPPSSPIRLRQDYGPISGIRRSPCRERAVPDRRGPCRSRRRARCRRSFPCGRSPAPG